MPLDEEIKNQRGSKSSAQEGIRSTKWYLSPVTIETGKGDYTKKNKGSKDEDFSHLEQHFEPPFEPREEDSAWTENLFQQTCFHVNRRSLTASLPSFSLRHPSTSCALSYPRGPSPAARGAAAAAASNKLEGRKEGKEEGKGAGATTKREPVNGLVVTPSPYPTLPFHLTPNPHPQLEPPPEKPDLRLRRSPHYHLRHGADRHPPEDRVSAGTGSGTEVLGACGLGKPAHVPCGTVQSAGKSRKQVTRVAAGLQIKNSLTSKDPDIKAQYQQSCASQCVAGIACAEIPVNQWPELIPQLVANVTNPNSTEHMKELTLEAISYICQDIDPKQLQDKSKEILTAIIQGMKKEEPSNNVKSAATNALLNSLEFTKANFDKESERHFIMQVVREATQCLDTRNLVKIKFLYYQYMETYMGPALFAITVEAMKSDIDEVTLQGIEFWSNVCDEEMDLAIEASKAHTSKFYAKGALQYLVPILTQTLTKQDENDDDDDWKPCKVAELCLMLLATCCEDDIVPHVLPFIKENIKNPDWWHQDAAVMALAVSWKNQSPISSNH
ncbi:hypothetical protein GH733_012050 [Mirounga leonina]|nr:hypothetical protein GH733_012050 [Mirounga leonina]